MNRYGRGALVTFTIAALSFAGVGASSAAAPRAANDPIFVGVYAIHGTITGHGTAQRFEGTLTVHADGTATTDHDNTAHWTSSGQTFTMAYRNPFGVTETFVGQHTAKGIGTRKHPGTFTSTRRGPAGAWWAVRQP